MEAPIRDIVNALLNRERMVLLARRSPLRKSYPGLWSFPGGHVESGETAEQALTRECREEIGITPTDYAMLGRTSDPNAPADDPVTYHMYSVTRWVGGEPTIVDDEHTELRWLLVAAAAALPDLALEEYRPLLNLLRSVFDQE
jgi:8-oxo-dGTP diphosphatase